MYCLSPNARSFQVLHLILHQGYQRRDYNTNAFDCQRWNLECYAFAATRRHESQSVVSGADTTDNIQLNAAKGGIAEVLF